MNRIIQQPIFKSFTAYPNDNPVVEIIALNAQDAYDELYNSIGGYKPNYHLKENDKQVIAAVIIG